MHFLPFWNGFVTQMTVHGQDIETYFGILKDKNSENWALAWQFVEVMGWAFHVIYPSD